MSKTYNEFVTLVRNWANRDEEVLSDAIVTDCMDYAIDQAYHGLRITDLEATVSYSSAELEASTYTERGGRTITELLVPSDLLEFIQIRGVDATTGTVRVFNEKADLRTFYDQYAEKYSSLAYWTQHGNNIVLSPGYPSGTEEEIYLHYYAKEPELNERYDPTAINANLDASYVVQGTPPTDAKTGAAVPSATLKKAVYTFDATGAVTDVVYYENTVADGDIPAAAGGYTLTITPATYYGALKPNWFRDENERILLNGALYHVFTFLGEPDSATIYYNRFAQEIQNLNSADVYKRASGGNIQININGGGLI